MIKDTTYYCHLFSKLRRDRKKGGAPHKPILLISIIQAFQKKIFNNNQIFITPSLVGLFNSNWNNLVETEHHRSFALPFYHMNSEPFWELIPNIGCELWVKSRSSMRSFSNLKTAIKYAQIDNELVEILNNKKQSEIILQFILETYFKNTKKQYNGGSGYLLNIEKQIIEETQDDYRKRLLEIQNQLDNDAFQEEIFVRGGVFKREVPKIYNQTCCISGLRIDATVNVSMIDACHIIPFSESYNDTITNGIALCPNLHRAFDRGLISINENYNVLINNNFKEAENLSYSLKQFEGKRIILPINEKYYPSIKSLKHHHRRFGF